MVEQYFIDILAQLSSSAVVVSFRIVRRRIRDRDGHLRVRCVLTNGDLLEFSEYVLLSEEDIQVADYSFQWQSRFSLIRRWDNTRHHAQISTFPAHVHIGTDENVKESSPMSLDRVLEIIEGEISAC